MTGRRRSVRSVWRVLVIAVVIVVGVALDEAIVSAPVIATTAWAGPLPAFVAFVTLYGVAGFFVALVVVRAYERRLGGRHGRLQMWIESRMERRSETRRARWASRLLKTGSLVSFAVSSILLGGILTTWLVRSAGRSRGIVGVAAASTVLWAVPFVGMYCGLARAVFGA